MKIRIYRKSMVSTIIGSLLFLIIGIFILYFSLSHYDGFDLPFIFGIIIGSLFSLFGGLTLFSKPIEEQSIITCDRYEVIEE